MGESFQAKASQQLLKLWDDDNVKIVRNGSITEEEIRKLRLNLLITCARNLESETECEIKKIIK